MLLGLKCYIVVKAPPKLVHMKNTALVGCLKTETALGFASCCICLSMHPPHAVFFIQTHSNALTNTHTHTHTHTIYFFCLHTGTTLPVTAEDNPLVAHDGISPLVTTSVPLNIYASGKK